MVADISHNSFFFRTLSICHAKHTTNFNFSIVSWLTTLQMSNTPNRHWSEVSLQIGVWVHKNVNQHKLNLNHSKSLLRKIYSISYYCGWKCWTNGIGCRTSWNDHFVWMNRLKWCLGHQGQHSCCSPINKWAKWWLWPILSLYIFSPCSTRWWQL